MYANAREINRIINVFLFFSLTVASLWRVPIHMRSRGSGEVLSSGTAVSVSVPAGKAERFPVDRRLPGRSSSGLPQLPAGPCRGPGLR